MSRSPRRPLLLLSALATLCALSGSVFAQGTAITYQGRLQADGAPAQGPYEMRFTLFDVLAGGTAVSPAVPLTVTVTDGLFSVEQLDFGACPTCFPGAPRFLEIGVRPAGSPDPFTVLDPRQAITAAPYAMRSTTAATADTATDATHLEGLDAGDFIHNDTAPQIADFNVSGNGTIGGNLSVGGSLSLSIVNAQTQYNLGGQRVLAVAGVDNSNLVLGLGTGNPSAGDSNTVLGFNAGASNGGSTNTFAGTSAGKVNASGSANAFFGASAGNFNVTGDDNSFFGREAGLNNLVSGNSFFGRSAGRANVNGTLSAFFGNGAGQSTTAICCNSFFGAFAGGQNTTGSVNAFFGQGAGFGNTTGFGNAFFGQEAGFDSGAGAGNGAGSLNTFLGRTAGRSNTTGSSNTAVGANANVASGTLSFATALGADAVVSTSNTLVLGRAADTVVVPGNLTVVGTINGGGGGGSFILNGTALQPSANFNISGTGMASLFDAQMQYNLQGQRFVSTSLEQSNTFVGAAAGDVSAPSSFNSFFGNSAGQFNGDGSSNSFFGSFAGAHNNSGGGNVFVGMSSGEANTSGLSNTFVGAGSGILNTLGSGNTFLGYQALGAAGAANVTAIGARASVTQDNSLVLGSINGVNAATADTNVGIGTTAPRSRLEVAGGDVYLSNAANGVVLKAPNGSCWRITVGNTGSPTSTAITCP